MEKITVLYQPKALPMDEANQKYSELNDYEKWKTYKKASKRARTMLGRHAYKTGIKILGTPCKALDKDPKYQGEYREVSIKLGEEFAQASLAAEIHILHLVGFPHYNLVASPMPPTPDFFAVFWAENGLTEGREWFKIVPGGRRIHSGRV